MYLDVEKMGDNALIDTKRMLELASGYGITLSQGQLAQLNRYAACLVEWNSRFNLTAITDPREIETKHFLDCLLLAAQPQVAGRVVDVGSGAGFPGLVVKILKPEVELTLMEPTGKRLEFLRHAAAEIGAEAHFVKERAEEAARKQWRESFDVATARAVAPLNVLCEYCLPLVRPGGVFIAMKSGEEPLPQAALQKLGGAYSSTHSFTLPDGAERRLLIFDKLAATPPQYPRNGGVISKRPL